MLFRRLSESTSGTILTAVEGYVVSVVAHVLVLVVFFTPTAPQRKSDEIPESFQWAKFLLPRDRSAASKLVREHITYLETPAPGGFGTLMDDAKEPERLELKRPEGTEADEFTEVAAAPPPQPEAPGQEVMTVLEVDTAVARYEDSAAPPYPPSMLQKRIEGNVAVQYVVDTTGRADTLSFVVLSMTHIDFARSVKNTLPLMRFRAAVMNSRKVRQLVQQQFTFKIDTTLIAAQQKKP
jgi:outer membrane biosynthesis protein TonB